MSSPSERGSALVISLFVMALLASMGIGLLMVTENEMKTSKVDHKIKKAFYLAEAGLEGARETLRVTNYSDITVADRETLEDELTVAAGGNGVFDFDPGALRATYDSSGNVTGFTGFGDDVPLRAVTSFGDGSFAAFMTNDVIDVGAPLTDSNDRVMITSVGAGEDRSLELVQAVVERRSFPMMPATITIIGPLADFDGGSSNAKDYIGDDCASGVPGLSVPTVGLIGAASEASAEAGVIQPGSYSSGTDGGIDTVEDVTATIDPSWTDCAYLLDLAQSIQASADVVGTSTTPLSALGTPGDPRVVYIDGDYTVPGGFNGAGLLWVTGDLTMSGNADWFGTIFVVGNGSVLRSGNGNGDSFGAWFVADISGPDRNLFTADDCSGQDGLVGTSDDGAAIGDYHVNGSGNSDTAFCSSAISQVQQRFPLVIVDFRQR